MNIARFNFLFILMLFSFFSCNKNSIVVIRSNQLGLEWNQSQTIDLGLVSVGSYRAQTFTLQNKSQNMANNCQPVELSDVTNFSVLSTTCGATMAPNTSCDVVVEASPQSAGFKDLSLRIKCDLEDAPAAPVAGVKVEAVVTDVSWTPTATRNFGSVEVNEYAVTTHNFNLTNGGAQNVTGCGAVTLTNSVDFEISSDTCTNPVLAAGATCAVGVRAKPMSGGVRNTSITRTCLATGTVATQSTKIKVTGVTPLLSVAPMNHNFSTVLVGSTSNQTFTFSNGSNLASAKNCSAPTISNTADFLLTSDTCANSNLNPSSSCTVNVRAQPQSAGLKVATLSRTCIVGGTVTTSRDQIMVTGQVPSPILAWSPATSNFGSVDIGEESNSQVFILQNSGSLPATSCGLPTLSNATDFFIFSDSCQLNNLNASSSCQLEVRARPSSVGLKRTTVSRTCSVGGVVSTTTDGIQATGVVTYLADWSQAHVGTAGSFSFNAVSLTKQSNELTFMYRNPTRYDYTGCTVPSLSNTTDFTLLNYTCSSGSMAKASLCFVTVKSHPQLAGTVSTTLNRSCDQSGTSSSMSLTAVGVDANSSPLLVNAKEYMQVATFGDHSCGLIGSGPEAGQVRCWGVNGNRQLGDGTMTTRLTPVLVIGLNNVSQIAVGHIHSCGLIGTGPEAGQVRCWGNNVVGQLGDGTTTGKTTTILVSGLNNVSQISAGTFYNCALIGSGPEAGQVRCWGQNTNGQLGDGSTTTRLTSVLVTGLNNVSQIALGGAHSCGLIGSGPEVGQVRCWGQNTYGQLGDGTTTDRLTSVLVSGLNNVSQIDLGSVHSCALIGSGPEAGQVRCWGYNHFGELGDGTTTTRLTSELVVGLNNVSQMALGGAHSCGLIGSGPEAGQVRCWGWNGNGQLGDGTTTNRITPGLVSGLNNISQIALGNAHGCALSNIEMGQMRCWGLNNGQLGNGASGSSVSTPVSVKQELKEQIATGANHSCSISKTGQVRCWGYNSYGQLGDGTTANRKISALVTGLNNISQVDLGQSHSCALIGSGSEAGRVRCWGWNGNGQLGDGTTTTSFTPVLVTGLNNVSQIELGQTHSCALIGSGPDAGQVRCWGSNAYGGLGDGTTTARSTPVLVSGLTNVAQISLGVYHSCGLIGSGSEAGQVRCWGFNGYGGLGDGTTTARSTPVLVSGLTNVAQISLGGYHSCGLIGSGPEVGQVRCWGFNTFGSLGDGTTTNRFTSVLVSGLSDVLHVTSGETHSCGLIGSGPEAGQVRCWGYNNLGQLGDGTTTNRLTPFLVNGLNNVSQIALGTTHSCSLSKTGQMNCWGYNGFGQLGDGTTSSRLLSTSVSGLNNVSQTMQGASFSCVLIGSGPEAGQVRCWGQNNSGQLGDGTTTIRSIPDLVSGLNNVSQIGLGSSHGCGLIGSGSEAGQVRCWGSNSYGQLGDGTITTRLTSVLVSGLSNVVQIAIGANHSCGLIGSGPEAGQVRCWGANYSLQLGDGTSTHRSTPVLVSGLNNVSQIAMGDIHSCALIGTGSEAGQVRCWGVNTNGGLGDGTTTPRSTPVLVSGLNNVSQISLGAGHSCGLIGSGLEAGQVRCWGSNGFGRLGDGTTTDRLTSVLVSELNNVSQISLGSGHSCGLIGSGSEAGQVRCWGFNGYGQLGDGTLTDRNKPVLRLNHTNIQSLGLSKGYFQCVVTSTQEVMCTGDNQNFVTGFNELTIRNVSGF